MHIRISSVRYVIGLSLTLGLAALLFAGCASDSPPATETTGSAISIGPNTSLPASDTTTTTLPDLLTDWDRELAKTATVQHDLAIYLTEQGVGNDDPKLAVVYGLRSRVQALSCRKALDGGDLPVADSAMRDVYSSLNLGSNLATGETAQILSDARALIETLGAPSDRPEEAAPMLEAYVEALAPLLEEAAALTPTTAST